MTPTLIMNSSVSWKATLVTPSPLRSVSIEMSR